MITRKCAMPLTHDEEIWAFHLGVAGELFFNWDVLDNPPVSSEVPYESMQGYANNLGINLASYDSAAQDSEGFLNGLTSQIDYDRPTLFDPFMFGRSAARLIVISLAIKQGLTYWKDLLPNTEQAVLFGASKIQVPEQKVKDWIHKVEEEPGNAQILIKKLEDYARSKPNAGGA
jgi:hypothetical protein